MLFFILAKGLSDMYLIDHPSPHNGLCSSTSHADRRARRSYPSHVRLVAQRWNLPLHLAALVCELGGIGERQ
jgi:hypothetical protein